MKYGRLLETGDSKKEAFSKVAAELKKQDTIVDAVVAEDGQAIWWTLKSGLTVGHTDYPEGTIGGGSSAMADGLDALVWAPFASGDLRFRGESAHMNAIAEIFQEFRCPGVESVETSLGKGATPDQIKKQGKDILYISSHGGVVPGDPKQSGKLLPGKGLLGAMGFKSPAAGTVYFWTKLTVPWDELRKVSQNEKYIRLKRTGKLVTLLPRAYITGTGKDAKVNDDTLVYYGVTSRWVESDDFPSFPPNSMVHLRACKSAANGTMAEAFLKKGVLAYTGFTDSSSVKWANAISETYFNRIRRGDSVDAAMGYARDKHGYTDGKHPGQFVLITGHDEIGTDSKCGATVNVSWSLNVAANANVAPSAEAANLFMKMDRRRNESGKANVIFREVYKDPKFPNLGKKLIPEGAFSFSARDEFKGEGGFKGLLEKSGETLVTGSGGDVWNREKSSKKGYGYISLRVIYPEEEVDLDKERKEFDEAQQELQEVLNDAPPGALANLPPEMLQAMGQVEGLQQQVDQMKPLTDKIQAQRPKPKKGQIAYELDLSVRDVPARKTEDGKTKEGTIGSDTPISIDRVVNEKSGSYSFEETGEIPNGSFTVSGTVKLSEGVMKKNFESE